MRRAGSGNDCLQRSFVSHGGHVAYASRKLYRGQCLMLLVCVLRDEDGEWGVRQSPPSPASSAGSAQNNMACTTGVQACWIS